MEKIKNFITWPSNLVSSLQLKYTMSSMIKNFLPLLIHLKIDNIFLRGIQYTIIGYTNHKNLECFISE